jgi:hypothetical protein
VLTRGFFLAAVAASVPATRAGAGGSETPTKPGGCSLAALFLAFSNGGAGSNAGLSQALGSAARRPRLRAARAECW